jgi:amino acid adenylation domain-containing protein
MAVLMTELCLLYNSYKKKEGFPLLPLSIQYKDYAVWQQNELKSSAFKEHKTYWLKRFEGEIPVLELPLDFSRPTVNTFKGGAITEKLSADIDLKLEELCRQSGTTPYMVLLASVYILLHRYSAQNDIVLGTPIACREKSGLEKIVGFFVNTLALRCQIQDEDSFSRLLDRVRTIALEAYQHQSFPFDELVSALPVQRDRRRNPLFDVMVTLKNAEPESKDAVWQMENVSLNDHSNICIFDLTFTFIQSAQGLTLELGYNSDIFTRSTAERIARHYNQVLQAALLQPNAKIQSLQYLSSVERQELLHKFNAPLNPTVEEGKTVLESFAEQVADTPDLVAVIFEGVNLTYRSLDEKSNQLANYLKERYIIQSDDLVGIQIERSEWLIISILAVLKSGAAYLPIDPDYPAERINFLLNDSNCKVLVNEDGLDVFRAQAHTQSTVLASIIKPDSLAYVIYTSGSTGNPKGVMVEHRNLFSFMNICKKKYASAGKLTMPLIASCSFDISLFQFLFPLLSGGTVVILPRKILSDTKQLLKVLKKVTAIDTVPALMSQILLEIESSNAMNDFFSVTDLFIGGDSVPDELLSDMRRIFPAARINMTYGPTESTVFVTGVEYNPDYNGPFHGEQIGWSNPNANIFILDSHHQPTPIGVAGEIYISGPTVARGYLNQKELTDQKFVKNESLSSYRLYKTGDLAKFLSDGTIAFQGRKDSQIKIRGFRIELGEIENVAQKHSDIIASVAVVTKDSAKENQVVLYVVADQVLNESSFRSYLRNMLPLYMIPARIVQLDFMPLTPNGKVDRNALAGMKPLKTESDVKYLAPRNELETKLVKIWQDLLDKDQIGIDDNFFEVGGNSIKIIKLSRQVSQVLNREVSIAELFEFPTIRQIVQSSDAQFTVSQEQEEFDRDELISDLDKIFE